MDYLAQQTGMLQKKPTTAKYRAAMDSMAMMLVREALSNYKAAMINAAAFCWSGGPSLEFERKAMIKKSGDRRADSLLDTTARNGRQVKEGA